MNSKDIEVSTKGNTMTKLKDLVPLADWFPEIDQEHWVISGPCSAESEEQVLNTARKLKVCNCVDIFRAGIWKPRTRPDSFEGVGEMGLHWLKHVKEETGLRIAVEVAHPSHVDMALKYEVDLIWIGARTTSNPFSVQELADHLAGTNLPVLVKNPVNPDISMWIGALERFYNAGIRKIGAVHRGFYPFEPTKLRNIPKWEIPIELKTQIHHLPIFCDPSHIAGVRDYLQEISQKAMDLNMNGLMIESHENPAKALSDKKQQLTPGDLGALLGNIVFRSMDSNNQRFTNVLEALREQIDSLDKQILELLAQRMNTVEEIGKYKSENKVTILQLRRWEKIIESRIRHGMKLGLTKDFIKGLLQLVHKESIQKQTDIMNQRQQGK